MNPAATDAGATNHTSDLGPLAWVLDETRKSLDAVTKSLKRFVRDAETARGVDLSTVDSGPLRVVRQQLHQVVGALEMVGQGVAAHMVRGMEGAAQQFVQRPEKCTEAAAAVLERAGFALIEYLEGQLGEQPRPALGLFPQFQAVQQLAGADRIHPADLWSVPWRWADPATPAAPQRLAYDARIRQRLDQGVLKIMKDADPNAASELSLLSLGLADGDSARQPVIFWKLCSGFFEALSHRLLPPDVYVKRAASRVLLQYTSLARGERHVSERLAHDLLFFCAQAQPESAADAPVLSAVRAAWGLASYQPVSYQEASFGLFDPALLAQARRRIDALKEAWSGLAGGDMARLKGSVDQFGLVADSLTRLHAHGKPLAQALAHTARQVAQTAEAPSPELAMEAATAVLFLEASFADFRPGDATFAARTRQLAERLEAVLRGGAQQPLDAWMEELYRRVSDRQTMGTVVGELRVTLGEIEQQLDQFFRNPADKTPLGPVPGLMNQMRGVLSVLGLDHATQAVAHMRETVDALLLDTSDANAPEPQAPADPPVETFERLGNSLGALGFLIDMLSYQPVLAKKLFAFDADTGELRPLMGRAAAAEPPPALDMELGQPEDEAPASTAEALDSLFGEDKPLDTLPGQLEQIAVTAALDEKPALAQAANLAAQAARANDTESLSGAMDALSALTTPPPAPPEPARTDAAGEDDDLLDIFLEEAREVVQTGADAIQALAHQPEDMEQQTTLRRAFHTLKGSSRMVGLTEFGEAAWAMEQLMNAWLAEQKAASVELRTLTGEAMQAFSRWVDAVAARRDAGWQAAPFRLAADALRAQGQLLPLSAGPDAEAAAPAAVPADEEVVAGATPLPPLTDAASPAGAEAATDLPPALDETGADEAAGLTRPPLPDAAQAFAALELPDLELPDFASPAEPVSEAPAAFPSDFDLLPAEEAVAPPADVETLPAPATESSAQLLHVQPVEGQWPEAGDMGDDAHQASSPAPEPTEVAALDLDTKPEPGADFISPDSDLMGLELSELDFAADGAAPSAWTPAEVSAAVPAEPFTPMAPEEAMGVDPQADDALEPPLAETRAATDATETATAEAVPGMEAPVADASSGSEQEDEQTKVIGHLRISIPLYNVYLNEADEWSRQLVTELGEWALELNHPVPERAIAHAHSLAGASATVGFDALSGLARAVEHALERLHGQLAGTPEQARVLEAAAAEIRRVLHQFAAGILRDPSADVLEAVCRLEACEAESVKQSLSADGSDTGRAEAQPQEKPQEENAPVPAWATEDGGQVHEPGGEASADAPHAEAAPEAAFSEADFAAPLAVSGFAPLEAQPEPEPAGARTTVTISDAPVHAIADDIDVADTIDEDLFPIFEEEAEELLPQLGTALRQWVAQPEDRGARSQVLRGLHTLKGSARLAGALRLGEMAHRTESAIELLGDTDALTVADVEPLLDHLDELENGFRRLQAELAGTAYEPQAHVLPPPAPAPAPAPAAIAPAPVVPAPVAPSAPAASATPAAPARQEVPAASAAPSATPAASATTPAQPKKPRVRGAVAQPAPLSLATSRAAASQAVRVRSQLLDRLVNQAGEVMTSRVRLEAELSLLRNSLGDLTGNLERLRQQLRDVELQAETQMQSRLALAKDANQNFDPLEFDRFTRMQELTRMMAESVNDVATVQRTLQRALDASEDDLAAQARQSRELQRDLLRTRMVEFESISERLYRVVRQAAKETGKPVKLDITGGSIEMDRGILDRMTPAFEHLLRNCVVHGIETAAVRAARSKGATGAISIDVSQAGNDVSVAFRDDGGGLNTARIRERAIEKGLVSADQTLTDQQVADLIFASGFTTMSEVSELAGRGVGMDVVRTEVQALGGRIETSFGEGQGSSFRLVLPLTTAVTHVVMVRAGALSIGVPSNQVEIVHRTSEHDLRQAYETGTFRHAGKSLPFFWSGALLQSSPRSTEPPARSTPVVIFRSAEQRIAVHVDEVLGNQEVVVKNLGPQLSRLPGLVAITALASGAVALIYNPVALAAVYGAQARAFAANAAAQPQAAGQGAAAVPAATAHAGVPLVLVVDDSITVRRVTQRMLQREGYRVALASDGLQGLERLREERPAVVLSDIEMPRMDGFDFVRNIRNDEALSDLPVIMITSRIAEKHREHARELGVNHYLGKPYSEEELLRLVQEYARAAVPAA
ncbi:response regulator [Comamonadaceae bacterium OH2545_COT-014]|nr:response regulator [Comamonadaceae bacterium OH2545_COT-014]